MVENNDKNDDCAIGITDDVQTRKENQTTTEQTILVACGNDDSEGPSTMETGDEAANESINDNATGTDTAKFIDPQSIVMAASIVKCTLTQLCILTNKEHIPNSQGRMDEATTSNATTPSIPQSEMNKLIRQIMLYPGKIISFSLLTQKGTFRKPVHGYSGKDLVSHLVKNILPKVPIGQVQHMLTGNRTKVYFFVKEELPEDETSEQTLHLIENLAKIGMSISEYKSAYETTNSESEKHELEYQSKKENERPAASKRQRTESQ